MGDVDEKGKALIECTRETLEKSIAICGPDVPYKEIGRVIWYVLLNLLYDLPITLF